MATDTAQDALRIVQESYPWVLQRKNEITEEWESVGRPVKGRTAAHELLNKRKSDDKRHEYRALPKNEADKYREGLSQGLRLSKSSHPKRSRRPMMALPENI